MKERGSSDKLGQFTEGRGDGGLGNPEVYSERLSIHRPWPIGGRLHRWRLPPFTRCFATRWTASSTGISLDALAMLTAPQSGGSERIGWMEMVRIRDHRQAG